MSLDITLTSPKCVHCNHTPETWSADITHNLNKMAGEAGIYGIVWRPEENDIESAAQLIAPLTTALEEMKTDPKRFKKYDDPEGWGTLEQFLSWLNEYLEACIKYPNATVTSCS